MLAERPTQQAEVDATQLLLAAFNSIAQTAFHANEDRSRATVFYLSALGGLAVARWWGGAVIGSGVVMTWV